MSVEFGTLERLSIQDVWASESRDFTPWLAENLGHLADQIGLDLELVATEVPVGPFRVDLVAQVTGSDDLVVVENQFGPTDHDHLGKLLTYAAGQQAPYAVWIAEHFRPEHRSALEWANHNSAEGVGYFGLQVEALQIGDSPVAVQLVTVVEPDQWAKQVARPTATLTPRNQLYMGFWQPLIERIKDTYPGWTSMTTPPKDSWMALPSGKSFPWYGLGFTGDKQLRIELYVDGPDEAAQQHLWEQLTTQRDAIDTNLPGLTWEPMEGKRASRIALYAPFEASVDRENEWETYRDWVVANLGPFRTVLQPHIDRLVPFDAGSAT